MKKVLILFSGSSEIVCDFKNTDYKKCYEFLYHIAKLKGIQLMRASCKWYDFNMDYFSHAYTFNGKEWKAIENVVPDLIYDKTNHLEKNDELKNKIGEKYTILNNPKFTALMRDKYACSELFPELTKRYYIINSSAELKKISDLISGKRIVIKPRVGSGGENIQIVEKSDINTVAISPESIAQEFIDSSGGIPGICETYHDLRLVFIDNELIYSYIRIPAKDSLLANLAQGGRMEIVENNSLPSTLQPIIDEVQKKLERYKPKVYTIDLIFNEKKKPWIVEFNTMPGLYFAPGQDKTRDYFYNKLIELFLDVLSKK